MDTGEPVAIFAWRIEVIGAQRYRFFNVSGGAVDQVVVAPVDDESDPDDSVEVCGLVDHLLGNGTYAFDQDLADGPYELRWHVAGTATEERRAVVFSVPPPMSRTTALLALPTDPDPEPPDARRC